MSRTRPRSSFPQSLSSVLPLQDMAPTELFYLWQRCKLLLTASKLQANEVHVSKKTQSKRTRKGSTSNESTMKYLRGGEVCAVVKQVQAIANSKGWRLTTHTMPWGALQAAFGHPSSCPAMGISLRNGYQSSALNSNSNILFKEQHVPEGDR